MSRREHLLKTSKFAEEKVRKSLRYYMFLEWRQHTAYRSLLKPSSLCRPKCSRRTVPYTEIWSPVQCGEAAKIYFENFVASYVTCTQQYFAVNFTSVLIFWRDHIGLIYFFASLWNDRSCYRQLRMFVEFTSHLQSQITAPAIKNDFFWTEGPTG